MWHQLHLMKTLYSLVTTSVLDNTFDVIVL